MCSSDLVEPVCGPEDSGFILSSKGEITSKSPYFQYLYKKFFVLTILDQIGIKARGFA